MTKIAQFIKDNRFPTTPEPYKETEESNVVYLPLTKEQIEAIDREERYWKNLEILAGLRVELEE